MTENPRTSLLRLARRRTAAIVLGTLAGTGLLTVGIAATAQQAAGQGGGTTSDTNSHTTNSGNVRQLRQLVGDQLRPAVERRLLEHGIGQLRRPDTVVMTVSTTWQDWSCSVRVTLAAGDGADLVVASDVVRDLMDDVARAASRFRADSDLSRVNAPPARSCRSRRSPCQLVDVALDAARRTDGAVDPTVGAHLLDAGYVDDIDQVRAQLQQSGTTASAPAPTGGPWHRP